MIYRISAIFLGFLAIIFLPYWLYVPIVIILVALLPFFWEAVFFGFLIDVLYGKGVGSLSTFVAPHAIGAALLIIIFSILKDRLRFNV